MRFWLHHDHLPAEWRKVCLNTKEVKIGRRLPRLDPMIAV